MSEQRDYGNIDLGIEGPPTEGERRLLQDLTRLDTLRASGDSSAVKEFLQQNPQVRDLDSARRTILKAPDASIDARDNAEASYRAIPEGGPELEKLLVDVSKAWRASEDAYQAARRNSEIIGEEREKIGYDTFRKELSRLEVREEDLGIKRQEGIYAVTKELGGRHYIFVEVKRVDKGGPLFRKYFIESGEKIGVHPDHWQLIGPASIDSSTFIEAKGDLTRVDEHTVQKGKIY